MTTRSKELQAATNLAGELAIKLHACIGMMKLQKSSKSTSECVFWNMSIKQAEELLSQIEEFEMDENGAPWARFKK